MTIEQIVEIPASRKLVIDGPETRHIPVISRLLNRRKERQAKALMEFYGCLADSPAWDGDSVEIIRRERDAWDAPLGNNEV